MGQAGEAATVRIGTTGTHIATYIAGIGSAHVTGSAVYINSNGQLGVLASSERYKTAIARMPSSAAKLQHLRPVTFRLKTDPGGALQYGLIAEEVNQVYPELVIRGADGQIEGVRYDELAPMLLNQMQQDERQLRELKQQLAGLKEANAAMQAAVRTLRDRQSGRPIQSE